MASQVSSRRLKRLTDARAKQETIEQARKYISFAVDRDARSAEGTAAQEQLNRLKPQNASPTTAPSG